MSLQGAARLRCVAGPAAPWGTPQVTECGCEGVSASFLRSGRGRDRKSSYSSLNGERGGRRSQARGLLRAGGQQGLQAPSRQWGLLSPSGGRGHGPVPLPCGPQARLPCEPVGCCDENPGLFPCRLLLEKLLVPGGGEAGQG